MTIFTTHMHVWITTLRVVAKEWGLCQNNRRLLSITDLRSNYYGLVWLSLQWSFNIFYIIQNMAYNISPSDPVWIDSNYSMRNTNNFSWMPKKEMVSWLGPAFPTMVTFQPLAGPGSVTWPMVDGHQIPHSEKTTQIEGSDICLNSFKSRFQIERYLQWNGGDCGGRVGPRCSFDVFLGGEPCVPKQFFKNKIKFPFSMSSLIWKQHSLRLALCNSERGLSIMSRGKGDIFLL